MNENLYEMILKRKSFHRFKDIGNEKITDEELKEIENAFYSFSPLADDIKVKMKIVKDSTTCKVGQEYCILLYSEKKENYLQNIGYIGEQLDLYLVSRNIGTLWCGLAKTKEKQQNELEFVIMIAIAKVDSEAKFRTDLREAKRKEATAIWKGEAYSDIADVVRFAPSACNSQPWIVDATEQELKVYRDKKSAKFGILPFDVLKYMNQIDMGIFLCILELCLDKNQLNYQRTLFAEESVENNKLLTAVYKME